MLRMDTAIPYPGYRITIPYPSLSRHHPSTSGAGAGCGWFFPPSRLFFSRWFSSPSSSYYACELIRLLREVLALARGIIIILFVMTFRSNKVVIIGKTFDKTRHKCWIWENIDRKGLCNRGAGQRGAAKLYDGSTAKFTNNLSTSVS